MKIKPVKIGITVVVYFLISSSCLMAQDIHFSQFTMIPLQMDPSQAGKFGGDQRAIINYRNQWNSVTSNPYKTYGASFDMHLNKQAKKDNFFGIGATAYSDKVGDIKLGTVIFNATIAYHIRINQESYLSAGVQGGILQNSLNPSNLRFDSQFDGSGHNENLASGENVQYTSFLKPDFAMGISYTWGTNTTAQVISHNGYDGKKVNIGAAVHHVLSPTHSYLETQTDNLNLRYIFHTTTSFGISGTNMAIQPSGFVAYQVKATEITIGAYFRYNLKEKSKYSQFSNGAALSLGTHYRVRDALIPSLLLEMGSIAVGMSYDFNLSGLSTVSNGQGGYEISIRYVSPNPFRVRKSQARFF